MERSLHTEQIVRGAELILRRRPLAAQVVKGPDKGLKKTFDADRVVAGTHPTCDVVLTDRAVSRHHLEIALVRDGWAVRDLDSTNGTFLDATRVRDVVVTGKVRLRLGTTVLQLAPLDHEVDVPLGVRTRFGPLLGASAAMRRVFAVLERVAGTETTVLLGGESGTGKEVAARALHEASRRAAGPFAVVDCGALPPALIESELYGHERGAFTGADRARIGAFEAAAGGTLFLDEVGELPLELQTRLLGVLERRRVQPLGGRETRPIDVRLVAATNRDLRREINRGAFREDLYFRLAVVTVELPPLRDRPEDVPLYVEAFLRDLAGGETPPTLDEETMRALMANPWRGNVRELRNAVERAVALGEVDVPPAPAAEPLATQVDPQVPYKVHKAMLLERFERAYVEALLARHAGNITRAARAAEIDRVYLLRLMDKFGLRR